VLQAPRFRISGAVFGAWITTFLWRSLETAFPLLRSERSLRHKSRPESGLAHILADHQTAESRLRLSFHLQLPASPIGKGYPSLSHQRKDHMLNVSD